MVFTPFTEDYNIGENKLKIEIVISPKELKHFTNKTIRLHDFIPSLKGNEAPLIVELERPVLFRDKYFNITVRPNEWDRAKNDKEFENALNCLKKEGLTS